MKTAISLFFIFMLPFSAIAHPGKTDYRGGHKCWKNCESWELQRGEYHLHDKNGKPLRLDPTGNVLETEQTKSDSIPEIRFRHEDPGPREKPVAKVQGKSEGKGVAPRDTAEKHYAVSVYEESILPFNAILLILLAFLIFLALILLRKKRERK